MTKTPVTYKETLQGVLTVSEIEAGIMDNLAKVQKYVFRNFKKLPIGNTTAKRLHQLLAATLFAEAGNYRRHDVQLGEFRPPQYVIVPQYMDDWERDYHERLKHIAGSDPVELCAWLMHHFLWIHPFFDYNGRVSRLLGELFMLQNNLPIISFHATRRTDFVAAVQEATATGDLHLLKKLINEQI